MFRTLRGRFILSHILPVLIIVPLMGIALVYVLETRVLLPSLANELIRDGLLIAEITGDDPDLWRDPARAQLMLSRIPSRVAARVMFLDAGGRLLASNDPADAGRLGQQVGGPTLSSISGGEISVRTDYGQGLHDEIADVWVPVLGLNQQLIGAIRLTYRLSGVYEQFIRLRSLIAGVLAAGLLLGTLVGWVLALHMERPLAQVTAAVFELAGEPRSIRLPEQGPEEMRVLVQAVNRLAERLRSLEQARRQLLANLVHELGNPLGALSSAILALRNGADQDIVLRRELLEGMKAETEQLKRLLDDLAHLHDQILGTLELNRRPVVLADWLPPALAPWREAARNKGLNWSNTIPADVPALQVDPDRLGQCLSNLIGNAIKYTPVAGTVSVSAGTEDGMVWIRVQDTGPGIPPEEQEAIFHPFYRGSANRRFANGVGLGLSIANDLVAANGGRLAVESTPGEGSTFTCWLPPAPAVPQPEGA